MAALQLAAMIEQESAASGQFFDGDPISCNIMPAAGPSQRHPS